MLTRLHGVTICDPSQAAAVKAGELWIEDERIVPSPADGRRADYEYHLPGRLVMAGGIDLHTHIGGGKTNLARLLLPERRVAAEGEAGTLRPLSSPVPGTWETGRRYLEMGYTACFEPAVLPMNARQAHLLNI